LPVIQPAGRKEGDRLREAGAAAWDSVGQSPSSGHEASGHLLRNGARIRGTGSSIRIEKTIAGWVNMVDTAKIKVIETDEAPVYPYCEKELSEIHVNA
jgi:hypothetical protein